MCRGRGLSLRTGLESRHPARHYVNPDNWYFPELRVVTLSANGRSKQFVVVQPGRPVTYLLFPLVDSHQLDLDSSDGVSSLLSNAQQLVHINLPRLIDKEQWDKWNGTRNHPEYAKIKQKIESVKTRVRIAETPLPDLIRRALGDIIKFNLVFDEMLYYDP